ncbi:hypothetical protein ERICIV_03572 [Paenibacillus larvae subsp. larvae]|uniref:Uncharacterized protein n=1 Tax=Paenibacillus larvae subsp. larvae TaxID=147375 RepID=A0A2L1U4U6_9BACL|nr:hypothetical protein [Paenibacillus larvae]AQZ46260.1 hypothetical protein B5S25_06095 [Paenibacillus larvae subsp. pulvifaciens]AVF27934.1 hypothetical protein ERICIII_03830 [Paenibacillus larvae subsp. larvae]AVF32436.1 hypothetical protein ERICIV_03572 [Paenibacillus larvae subsp. larvae]MCY7520102.1 hypothetical protein [Paenibacillus larvae]MCY9681128.1 hypothetical protein [Paenibacillus larvae]
MKKLPKGLFYSNEVIHIFSVSCFDITPLDQEKITQLVKESQHFEDSIVVNNFEEKLNTWIFANEMSRSGYQNYRIVTDEVIDLRVRVKGEEIDQVVRTGAYEIYYHPTHRRLVAMCRKDDAFKATSIFEKRFPMQLEKHKFNILGIIDESTDVRGARFDVKIETVTGVSLKGSNINGTQYYANMIQSGQLTGVIVTYDHGDRTVTFRVSVDGTLLFYTQLDEYDCLDFIDMLYAI